MGGGGALTAGRRAKHGGRRCWRERTRVSSMAGKPVCEARRGRGRGPRASRLPTWKGRVSAPARNCRSLAAGAATAGGTSASRVLRSMSSGQGPSARRAQATSEGAHAGGGGWRRERGRQVAANGRTGTKRRADAPLPETHASGVAAASSAARQPAELGTCEKVRRSRHKHGEIGGLWTLRCKAAHRNGPHPEGPRRRPTPRAGSPRLAGAPFRMRQTTPVPIHRNAEGCECGSGRQYRCTSLPSSPLPEAQAQAMAGKCPSLPGLSFSGLPSPHFLTFHLFLQAQLPPKPVHHATSAAVRQGGAIRTVHSTCFPLHAGSCKWAVVSLRMVVSSVEAFGAAFPRRHAESGIVMQVQLEGPWLQWFLALLLAPLLHLDTPAAGC